MITVFTKINSNNAWIIDVITVDIDIIIVVSKACLLLGAESVQASAMGVCLITAEGQKMSDNIHQMSASSAA